MIKPRIFLQRGVWYATNSGDIIVSGLTPAAAFENYGARYSFLHYRLDDDPMYQDCVRHLRIVFGSIAAAVVVVATGLCWYYEVKS
ncbi:hypothetical protein ACFQW4_06635 [Pantoea sp. GCM10028869]|uniref:hypothetical protein n=1 Tax=Pantoea sp. GCM10028869 TaxID=3273417 RepID=UPI00361C3C11